MDYNNFRRNRDEEERQDENFRRDRDEEERRDENFRRDRNEENRQDEEERRRRNRNEEDRFDEFDNRQFGPGPGRFPMPPVQPFPPIPPMRPEPPFPPRMEGPRMAPPNFTPQFQQEMMGRPMDIRRCLNRFVFIWLINGNSFWFYPIFVGRDQIVGFRWRRNGWMYDRINLRRIAGFRCF